MIRVRTAKAAAWPMLLISTALHVALIVAFTVALGNSYVRVNPTERTVTKVTLVDPAPAAPSLETAQTDHATGRQPEVETLLEAAPVNPKEAKTSRNTIEAKKFHVTDSIKPTKKKRTAKSMETPKPKETAKKPKESEKKKEDPSAFLEKRLAGLRESVEKRKAESPKNQAANSSGSGAGRGAADRELNRWFKEVKDRINAHWSIMGESGDSIFTLISIQLTDSGALTKAVVDAPSGDKSFDLSAMRAVMQASPFPPMPVEVKDRVQKSGGLALRFTPKGLQ